MLCHWATVSDIWKDFSCLSLQGYSADKDNTVFRNQGHWRRHLCLSKCQELFAQWHRKLKPSATRLYLLKLKPSATILNLPQIEAFSNKAVFTSIWSLQQQGCIYLKLKPSATRPYLPQIEAYSNEVAFTSNQNLQQKGCIYLKFKPSATRLYLPQTEAFGNKAVFTSNWNLQ